MEVVEDRRDLSSTAPSHVAQGFLFFSYTFSLLSLSLIQTHVSILAYVYIMHIHFM